MKILQINKFYHRRGGADHHFLDLSELLEQNGENVIHFSMQHKNNLVSRFEKYFVSYVSFAKGGGLLNALKRFRMFYSFEAVRKLEKLIKEKKPDIAHVHLAYHQIPTAILKTLKKNKIPVVLTIHDWKIVCPNYHLYTQDKLCTRCSNKKYSNCLKYRCIDNSFAKSAAIMCEAYFSHTKKYYENYVDCYIAPSEFVKRTLVDVFGYKGDKITVLPHFLSPAIQIKQSANKTRDFVYVGRLSKEKGIKKLVEYWAEEKQKNSLDIYGDGPLMDYLTNYVKEKKLDNVYLHGMVEPSQLNRELGKFKALIVPSIVYETFGLAVIEAFASGIAVVANNLGPLPDLVNKAKGGEIFDWKDKRTLIHVLEKVQKNDYMQSITEYVTTQHSYTNYYEKITEVYRKYVEKEK